MTLSIAENETYSKVKRHSILVYPKEFKQKPDNKIHVGRIQNYFKRNPNLNSKTYTLKELVAEFCKGKTLVLASVQSELREERDAYKAANLNRSSSDWANLHVLNFKSSTILGMDIDDEYSLTDIEKVLKHFNGKVSAAYYSFSHGRVNDQNGTENRYRLLFQLDEPLTDFEVAKEFVAVLKSELLELYPEFPENKIDVQFPTSLWHGSALPSIYVNEDVFLNVSEYMVKVGATLAARREAAELDRKNSKESFNSALHDPILFEELEEMAEAIGYLPSKTTPYEVWFKLIMAIRSHEYAELITEEEGLKLFYILAGSEANERDYLSLRPKGKMGIGTLIKHAVEECGFKRKNKYGYALQETLEAIPVERVTVGRFIPPSLVGEWLGRRERLIIDSPTGSGKTSAVMKYFKQAESKARNFYLFAVPTIALAEQVAAKYGVTCAKGGIEGFEHLITSKVSAGERIFVSTYDKMGDVVSQLDAAKDSETYLVVDEIHKYTEAYNYRYVAINNLKKLSEMATSLLGLSGTSEDILKTDFDALIKVDNGIKSSPNGDFRVFTYDTVEHGVVVKENADLMLMPVVRRMLDQTRVLLFINNKDRIQRIAKLLRLEGITVQTISSDNRKSVTYTSIIENEAIDPNVQVVICTVVLADGVSIDNDPDWSCLVVSDESSPIFNPSTIKQISNRFRNKYKYFAIYMRSPNPDYTETRRFNIESEYQYRLKVVRNHVEYLNKEFEEGLISDFIPSTVERFNGIYYKSAEEAARIELNELFTRHQSAISKEYYYRGHRNAFMNEVGRTIGHESAGIININDHIKKNGSDLSSLLMELQIEAEVIKLEANELRANFASYFTEEVYEAIVYQRDESSLDMFRDSVHADQWSATLRNARLTDFKTCKKLGAAIKRRADISTYSNDIKALAEIATFDHVREATVTKKVFKELSKLELKTYTSAEFKTIIEDKLPKSLKVRKVEVKEALKLFHRYSSRSEKERYTSIAPLTVDLVAKVRHEVEPEAVEKSVLRYIDTRSTQQRKVMRAAVLKKWGIDNVEDDFLL